MISRTIKSVAAAGLMAGALVAVAPHAFASSHASSDAGDNVVPASTVVTAKLKTGTTFKATGTINGLAITVTCTTATFTGKTPATGLGPVNLTKPPTFSGCKDSLGGTDTVTTTGTWKLTYVDGTETGTTDTGKDKLIVTVPKDGATFKSNSLSTCTVIVAPTAPVPESANYSDSGTTAGTASAVNDTLPVKGSGCTATTSKVTETLTLSPKIKDS